MIEHSCNPQMVSECKEQCRDAKWASEFSCTDPELSHLTGGVAALVRQPSRLFPIEPTTQGLKDCINNGRMGFYAMDIGQDTMGICFLVYGWTGGHGFNEASARTNACFRAIRGEIATRPGELVCCGGDFNSSPEYLPDLLALMEDYHWVDIGGDAAPTFGERANRTTCTAPSSAATDDPQPTRSDSFFASPSFLPIIENV